MKVKYLIILFGALFALITPSQSQSLSEDEALRLIFETNFTNFPVLDQSLSPFPLDQNEQQSLLTGETLPNRIPTTTSMATTTSVTPAPDPNQRYPPFNEADFKVNASYESCGSNKVCVPFYLCKNGTDTINTDGEYLIDIRFDDSKPCAPYLERCCHMNDRTDGSTLKGQSRLKEYTFKGCGNRNTKGIVFRITGDEQNETEYGEFPWMVAVLREEHNDEEILKIYKCGGSLIHPSVVMTAAHCVFSYSTTELVVRAGEWDSLTKNEFYPEQDRRVKKMVLHDKFNRANLYYNIALLFTVEPFSLAEHINTICVPPPRMNFDRNRECFGTGWGKNIFGKEGRYAAIMKKVGLPMVASSVCQAKLQETRLGRRFRLHETFVCAGGEPGKDTCTGDGGGPLVCQMQVGVDRYYQTGIIAWGIGCGDDVPGVYSNVAYFRDWIDDVFAHRNLNNSYYTAS